MIRNSAGRPAPDGVAENGRVVCPVLVLNLSHANLTCDRC